MNYYHLNINERTVISQLYISNVSIRSIAKQLHRNPSTISRELKRNNYKKSAKCPITVYSPSSTQTRYK